MFVVIKTVYWLQITSTSYLFREIPKLTLVNKQSKFDNTSPPFKSVEVLRGPLTLMILEIQIKNRTSIKKFTSLFVILILNMLVNYDLTDPLQGNCFQFDQK